MWYAPRTSAHGRAQLLDRLHVNRGQLAPSDGVAGEQRDEQAAVAGVVLDQHLQVVMQRRPPAGAPIVSWPYGGTRALFAALRPAPSALAYVARPVGCLPWRSTRQGEAEHADEALQWNRRQGRMRRCVSHLGV